MSILDFFRKLYQTRPVEYYEVESYAIDKTGKKIKYNDGGYTRIERISTEVGDIFEDAKDEDDVKEIYEAFWNEVPTVKPPYTCIVSKVTKLRLKKNL